MRDDLAPLRAQLPLGVTRLGYAAAFKDTPYGLWQPFGSRVVVELGLPLGTKARPPANLEYAVVTADGLRARYGMSGCKRRSLRMRRFVPSPDFHCNPGARRIRPNAPLAMPSR